MISAILLYCLTVVILSILIDGKKNAIVAPFWRKEGNPRKAFNKIENKKILDSIREIKASKPENGEKKTD